MTYDSEFGIAIDYIDLFASTLNQVGNKGCPDIQKRIEDVYDIDVSDIESGNLLEIFTRIHPKKCSSSS